MNELEVHRLLQTPRKYFTKQIPLLFYAGEIVIYYSEKFVTCNFEIKQHYLYLMWEIC